MHESTLYVRNLMEVNSKLTSLPSSTLFWTKRGPVGDFSTLQLEDHNVVGLVPAIRPHWVRHPGQLFYKFEDAQVSSLVPFLGQ
ncbi:hypothetical protein K443DRAFT_676165 [Laccaria amethystina LaAM-08-1]|jgi:hypothetical protein|uniref:Uncharacterized protein n=1 Tax=Laccaria amethystina LaAM-08-1 TaxID=1095629 RepID=A0A0C9Y2A0_9AGAR|nr:hypothetical protein K443DRAFT_676165 [Laccaria amethystina LaAM-08-1]